MLKSIFVVFLLSVFSIIGTSVAQDTQRNRGNGNEAANVASNNNAKATNNNANAGSTGLNAQVIQDASKSNGSPSAGQAASLTDSENFINFCEGKTLTNGEQITTGSCNGIVMGDIPSKDNMIAAMILNPQTGKTIQPNTPFDVSVQVQNLVAGVFTNPNNTYYAAPQQLQGGKVVGHCHVVIQKMQSLNDATPPAAATFAFFKGIDDDGNGQGLLKATVTAGLPAGFYRVCTMMGSSNHQPPLMPVAQRGAQEDCTKFEVSAAGNNANNGNTANNDNNAASATSTTANGNGRGRNGGAQTSTDAVTTTTVTINAQATASSSSSSAGNVNDGEHNNHNGDRNSNSAAADSASTTNNANGAKEIDTNRGDMNDRSGSSATTTLSSFAASMTGSTEHRHQNRSWSRHRARGRRYIATPEENAPQFEARPLIV